MRTLLYIFGIFMLVCFLVALFGLIAAGIPYGFNLSMKYLFNITSEFSWKYVLSFWFLFWILNRSFTLNFSNITKSFNNN